MYYLKKLKPIVIIILFSISFLFPQNKIIGTTGPDSTVLNINNWELWVKKDGSIPSIGKDGNAGYYPHGVNAIYLDGILFGTKVDDGKEPRVRVVGNTYVSGLKAGKVLYDSGNVVGSEEASDQQIWRVRRDYKTADLAKDAASTLMKEENAITSSDKKIIYNRYRHDWQNWPWQKGAPYEDLNESGIYEPDTDIPGRKNALQTIWLVANDLPYSDGTNISTKSYGSPPIGIELQMTVWATLEPSELAMEHTVIKEYKFIYTGLPDTPQNSKIDTMYLTEYANVDLGDFSDDRVGYDSTLTMGYFYNCKDVDNIYHNHGLNPPAVGFCFLDRPEKNDAESSMSSFYGKVTGSVYGDPYMGSYNGTLQWFNYMEGYLPYPEYPLQNPIIDPTTGAPTKFTYYGNPLTGDGWVDTGGGERRFWMTCGPFSMALGDTQRAVIAIVGANNTDYLNNITILKKNVLDIRTEYKNSFLNIEEATTTPTSFSLSQNYPNPFNPTTTVRYDLPKTSNVEITIYNILGEKISTLINGRQQAGVKEVTWNGTDDFGRAISAGIYIYQIRVGDIVESRKMVLMK